MAARVKHVIGFEIVQNAIENAKRNAQLNGIDNIEFVHGPAERTVPALVAKLTARFGNAINIVAIVDPPRAGVRKCFHIG